MKKLLLLALALVMTLSMLCACGNETDPVEDTTTVDTTTTVAETEAPAPQTVDIVVDGKSMYSVIRDEDAETSALVVTQARKITIQLKNLTGATAKLETDWVKKGQELDSTKYEILVGVTDHPETREVMKSLTYGEWAIRRGSHIWCCPVLDLS